MLPHATEKPESGITDIDRMVEETHSEQNSNMSINFNDTNMCYFPEIINYLKRLFKQFSL